MRTLRETSLERYVQLLTNDNVTVLFGKYHPSCCFTGKHVTIKLPNLIEDNKELETELIGYCLHESGHALFTLPIDDEFYKDTPHSVVNIIEDFRIEKLIVEKYAGASYYLNYILEQAQQEYIRKQEELNIITTLCAVMNNFQLKTKMYLKIESLIKNLLPMPLLKHTYDSLEYARKIWDCIKHLKEEDDEKTDKNNAYKTEINEEGDESLSEPLNDLQIEKIQYIVDKVKEKLNKQQMPKFNIIPDWVYPLTTEGDTIAKVVQSSLTDYSNLKNQLEFSTFANKIRLYLMSQNRNKNYIGQYEGDLDMDMLAYIKTDPNKKDIYTLKRKNISLDIAISVLVDQSGSMSDIRSPLIFLAETLSFLNIPFEIIGFGSNGLKDTQNNSKESVYRINNLNMDLYKTFDQRYNQIKTCLVNVKAQGYTPLPDGLLFTAKRIFKRKNKRKYVWVLTDGEPTYNNFNPTKYMKNVISLVEKNNINIIGIGLSQDAKGLKEFFSNFVLFDESQTLAINLLKQLKMLFQEKP